MREAAISVVAEERKANPGSKEHLRPRKMTQEPAQGNQMDGVFMAYMNAEQERNRDEAKAAKERAFQESRAAKHAELKSYRELLTCPELAPDSKVTITRLISGLIAELAALQNPAAAGGEGFITPVKSTASSTSGTPGS
jgi:hypothetical protein